mgnify:FL=1|jgi:hypothetical protein
MNPNRENMVFRVLVLITRPKLADRATEMFQKGAIPVQFKWNAVGTASSEMIDVLGLGSPDKSVLISFMPKIFADKMLKKFKSELKLGTVNSGIAFTLPLSGANNLVVRMLEQLKEYDDKNLERKVSLYMSDIKYSLIAAVVNQGYSENVMEAAKAAGANGGTVVPSRGISNEQAMGFWGMSIQHEKDMVFIVADSECKLDIMKAIAEKCGVHSDAKGIVLSLPIDSVIGFETSE